MKSGLMKPARRKHPYLLALAGLVGRVLFGLLAFLGTVSVVYWIAVIYFAFNCEMVEGLCLLLKN